MAVSTLGKRGGDFVVHVESPQKCFNTATLTLDTGGADGGGMASQIAGVPGVLSAGIFTPVLPADKLTPMRFWFMVPLLKTVLPLVQVSMIVTSTLLLITLTVPYSMKIW